MHEGEVSVDDATVRGLLMEQFPEWADGQLRRIPDSGTDNAIYRLGEDMGIRLPRIDWAEAQIEKSGGVVLTRLHAHPIVDASPRKGCPLGRLSQYPEEFRREAVRLVVTTDKPMAEVARDLGVNYKTLGNWVRSEKYREQRDAAPGAISESESHELTRLRKENAELKTEREILRKASAYFAKETMR
jgi:transposase